MDPGASPPGSSAGGPLQPATPERVNRQDPLFSPLRSENRDNVVHDKISQFNNMSIAMQSKQLERKTADAALKRAMLGREEAEADAKRLREENRLLRKEVEGGKERERKVGERLEAVMENYGRAKETHAHTQALWEKEIRRARKENFKSQSAIVKLQEELKSARATNKTIAESLEREKERSKVREQEAFTARYQIVGVQGQLDKALEHIKIVEQERDAFKTAAKNEEVARIAAEGRLPLPVSNDPIEEPESPEKERIKYLAPPKRGKGQNAHRVSLSTMEIMSSAASEMEIEELNTKVLWERQRADRAQEMIEFLQAECQMHLCSCSRDNNSRKSLEAPQKRRRMSMEQEDQKRRRLSTEDEEHTILVKEGTASPAHSQRAAAQSCSGSPRLSLPRSPLREEQEPSQPEPAVKLAYEPIATPTVEACPEYEPVVEQGAEKKHPRLQHIKSKKEPRRSTIFCRKEGIFRTVSEQEAAAFEAAQEEAAQKEAVMTSAPAVQEQQTPATAETERSPRNYARTPSVEPPTFALIGRPERNSLDFLLLENLNDDDAQSRPVSPPSIPTAASDEPARTSVSSLSAAAIQPRKRTMSPRESLVSRAHSASTSSFTVTTTVPLREDTARSSSAFNERLRTPSHGSTASFDSSDPAMTPTMTREQALAKIRERRGRARSAAQAATTSSGRKAVGGGGAATTTTTTTTTGPRGRALKRDMSAPMAKTTPRIK